MTAPKMPVWEDVWEYSPEHGVTCDDSTVAECAPSNRDYRSAWAVSVERLISATPDAMRLLLRLRQGGCVECGGEPGHHMGGCELVAVLRKAGVLP